MLSVHFSMVVTIMSERKKRRDPLDILDIDEEDEPFILEPGPIELGSGYSISVTYGEDNRPVIHVKTYGDIDATELRKEIKQKYRGAKIEGLEKPLIKVAKTHKAKAKKGTKPKKRQP